MPRGKRATNVEVEALRHSDSRVNIPTSELRDFAGDAELMPPTLRYQRDPSLDPQLVWNGKDEQDGDDLTVPAVPIYIQEKIHPQAIVEEVRRAADAGSGEPEQLGLFNDFNGISFEQMIEFYEHEQHWTNRMILGDSLLVMTSLAEKEGLKSKVQMIYIDPPYGIKFGSNWQVSTRKRDVKDGREEDLVRQPEQVRAFRDTWEKGIHSYLSYLRDRLILACELLTDSGSIFVQIGDENVHLVRSLMDEILGSENFVSMVTVKKTSGASGDLLSGVGDYLIWYAKNRSAVKYHQLYLDKEVGGSGGGQYTWIKDDDQFRRGTKEELQLPTNVERIFRPAPFTSQRPAQEGDLKSYIFNSKSFTPGKGTFKTNYRGLEHLRKANRLLPIGNTLTYVRYLNDFPELPISNLWEDTVTSGFTDPKIYVVQTNTKISERCLLMTTDPGDLVLDPTMGSGTTAYVAEQWGRRWITIDTSRVSLALARTRLMAARYPFYLLADSADGAAQEMEASGIAQPPHTYKGDVKQGFVYERVPHVTLRDIANNEEIDTIYETWQPYLEERRAWLNQTLFQSWDDWEIPRGLPGDAPKEAQQVLSEYWQGRRERQAQIDASIARNSEREILYDRPYEDKRKVRVTGPFTVESLSPHRILDPETAEKPAASADMANVGSYEQMIIDNLRIAGVQNTRRAERLTFQSLEPFPGIWLHARGSYLDADGQERTVAVSIGSEHGTVTARQIQSAAIEAVKGFGVDLLLICGFAFEAATGEESKRYGKLDVQIVRMNADLMMGTALKQTASANLFTIFGEPDLDIHTLPDGRYAVEIRGLDIYDPTTGQIRSSSVDDIACWFIDTDYNEASFFVRHAYFLGKDDAYDNLKRALRTEISEDAWNALYQTRSLPFDKPDSGKLAVKVINHYGDEVLKVYALP